MDLKNKKVLVIGLGLSGKAASTFCVKHGAQVVAFDQNKELLAKHPDMSALRAQGIKTVDAIESYTGFDLAVVSPGVPPTNPIYAGAKQAGLEVIGEVELACRFIKQPCLGITGSNGKTTTTLLTAHVLSHVGKPARAIGNVGLPMTAVVDAFSKEEILVAELSSWQLETLHTPILDAAVILNITPNHLDRHGTLLNYAQAKLNIRQCLKPTGSLFMSDSCFAEFFALLEGFPVTTYGYSPQARVFTDKTQVYVDQKLEFILPEQYRGWVTHDVENLLAAYVLCKTQGVQPHEFLNAFVSFQKPPHRIEYVETIAGVAYFDDSKATSIDAVAKAVESMRGATVLIAGGLHKGTPYTSWLKSFVGKVKRIFALGQAADLIRSDLGAHIPVEICETLEGAVHLASQTAQDGENVLLSPGCASYDMFKDFNHRGEEFKRIVKGLKK